MKQGVANVGDLGLSLKLQDAFFTENQENIVISADSEDFRVHQSS